MVDSRIKKLAGILVNHSTRIKKGNIIKINFGLESRDCALECYRMILEKGAFPITHIILPGFAYTYYKNASIDQLSAKPKIASYEAKTISGSISIGAEYNTKEFSNIDPQKIAIRSKVIKPISEIHLKKDNWVGCEFPTHALAQDADMSLEEFEDFFYTAALRDWNKIGREEEKLKKILDRGHEVRIVSSDTDITFSIRSREAVKSYGLRNLPDGEVFIAPVENTVEGFIRYSYPAIWGGREIDGIYLEFRKGKVVTARATKNEEFLHAIINTDKGARFLGEFGIGFNYKIKRFVKQIIFDEKIGGTIHLALGMAYKKGGGLNESAIHWDMIKDLRQGGMIWIDGKLIQKNGKFCY